MKKHILIVSQYFYPEPFRINDIAVQWVKRGYRVTVLTGIPNYPAGKTYPGYGLRKRRTETWRGVQIVRLPLIPRGKCLPRLALNYLSFLVSGLLWAATAKLEADVVFTFGLSPVTQALIGIRYAEKHDVRHLLYVQDLWPESVEAAAGIRSPLILRPLRALIDRIYRRSERIFASSPSFVEAIGERVPQQGQKVIYWPQYAEDFYRKKTMPSPLIPRDGILNITFTGNIGTAQGLQILPETAKLLKRRALRVRFVIVGDGRSRALLRAQVAREGVEPYFHWIDRQPPSRIAGILAASDAAFVSFADEPLYAMTIPAKLQTYLACAKPILACARGETARIIREADCGICCPIGDAQALCCAVERLCFADRAALGKRARVYYERNFRARALMAQMEEHLQFAFSGENGGENK